MCVCGCAWTCDYCVFAVSRDCMMCVCVRACAIIQWSVEADRVEKRAAAFVLKLLQQFIHFILHIISVLNTLAELTDEEGSECSLLVVVLDVHVDDVHRLESLLFTGVQIFQDLVIHSLLTGDDQIKLLFTALEPLRPGLDALVPLQHVQNTVLCV